MFRAKFSQSFLILPVLVFSLLAVMCSGVAQAQSGGQLTFCLRNEPKTFNPLLVQDDASEAIRYMTGGMLARVDRKTQQLQPELATSWKVSNGGRTIRFKLREGVVFSDGTPFSNQDVAYTMTQLMDPAVHSPTGDAFRSAPGAVKTDANAKN